MCHGVAGSVTFIHDSKGVLVSCIECLIVLYVHSLTYLRRNKSSCI